MAFSIPPGVLGFVALLALLGLFAAGCAIAWLSRNPETPRRQRNPQLLAACGVGLAVFGVRLWISRGQVSWAPYLDQWEAEIGGLMAPLVHGTLNFSDLVAVNNEHRVILTRATTLVTAVLNGEWDNRVAVVVIFLLQGITAAWACAVLWRFLGWARGTCVALAAVLPMTLICDWENIVSGFQDQFCFMVLGSLVAFALLADALMISLAGWGALAIAALLLGSMGSGLLAAATMAAGCLLRIWVERRGCRSLAGFAAACAAIAVVGVLTRAPLPPDPTLSARNPGQWASAFLAYASWPLPPCLAGLGGLWLPWFALFGRIVFQRSAPRFAPFVFCLGLWVLLQAAALAWARASLSGLVSSRYTEVLGWGCVANAAALVLLFLDPGASRRMRLSGGAVFGVWLCVVGGCEIWRSHAVYRPYLEAFRRQTTEHEQRLEAFLGGNDETVITHFKFPQIPFTAEVIVPLLRDPAVQPVLPAPLRRALADGPQRPPGGISVEGGPLSFAAVRAMRHGLWFAAGGAVLLCAAAVTARRRATRTG